MSHGTHINESCHKYESCLTHKYRTQEVGSEGSANDGAHSNKSRNIYG